MAETATENQTSRRRRGKEEEEEVVAEEAPANKGRVTPGRRSRDNQEDEGNFVTRAFGNIREYLSGVREELQKVTWPTREEAVRLTRIVLITLLVAAIVMGTINYLFSLFIRFGISTPIAFVVLFAVVAGVTFYVFRREGSGRSGY